MRVRVCVCARMLFFAPFDTGSQTLSLPEVTNELTNREDRAGSQ